MVFSTTDIDLCKTGLVEKCTRLDVDFRTVDFVVNEITNPAQAAVVKRQIDNGHLTVLQFSQEESLELMNLYARYEYNTNLSLTDCAVMLCAKRGDYRLLTGDKNLRIKATNEGVMVSGILFLTDMMVNEKVVAPLDMANYLEELLRTNNRNVITNLLSSTMRLTRN